MTYGFRNFFERGLFCNIVNKSQNKPFVHLDSKIEARTSHYIYLLKYQSRSVK
jgi:hypothetical protein